MSCQLPAPSTGSPGLAALPDCPSLVVQVLRERASCVCLGAPRTASFLGFHPSLLSRPLPKPVSRFRVSLWVGWDGKLMALLPGSVACLVLAMAETAVKALVG